MNVKSFLVSNVILSTRVRAGMVLSVHYSGKILTVALCGGEIAEGETFPRLTSLGSATFFALDKFLSKENSLVFRVINCDCSDKKIHDKIEEVLRYVENGGAIIFVGDHAGACDGKLLKHLNIQSGFVELENK